MNDDDAGFMLLEAAEHEMDEVERADEKEAAWEAGCCVSALKPFLVGYIDPELQHGDGGSH